MSKTLNIKKIETENIVLLPLEPKHNEELFFVFNDKDAVKFANVERHNSPDDTLKFIEIFNNKNKSTVNNYTWSVKHKRNKRIVGLILVNNIDITHGFGSFASILLKSYWNKGIMTESHIAVIKYIFKFTELNRLESQFYESHKAVEKMLIKSGMKREGLLRENFLINNKYNNSILYSVIKSDLEKLNRENELYKKKYIFL